jgi:hypothetical protein
LPLVVVVGSIGVVCVVVDIGCCCMDGAEAAPAGLSAWAYAKLMAPAIDTAATVAAISLVVFMGYS